MAVCDVCFRHCDIRPGGTGFCGARTCVSEEPDSRRASDPREDCSKNKQGGGSGERIVAANYGRITSLALDPIEKKPLKRFWPGSLILSAGSYGCNLRCPFCQNSEISWSEEAMGFAGRADYISPEDLAETAAYYRSEGNIGAAFTYNEPLVGYEYVRDAAKLIHEKGMKNVLVTNGTAGLDVLREIAPYIDAMNIDLKGFSDRYYSKVLGGDRQMVMDFIKEAVKVCHVEITTLIVPHENDSEEEMEELSSWIAGLTPAPEYYAGEMCGDADDDMDEDAEASAAGVVPAERKAADSITGADIPLHVTRFFPAFHMRDRDATDAGLVLRLAETARRRLKYVYPGNI